MVCKHTHTHTLFRIARRRNKRNKPRGEGRRRDRMNLYRRRSSTRNTRSLNNESRFHFFSSLLLGFFFSFFLSPLFRGLKEWILCVYTGLPEGLDRENDENSIEPILNRIPTEWLLVSGCSFLIFAEDPFDEEIEYICYILGDIRRIIRNVSGICSPRFEAIEFYS